MWSTVFVAGHAATGGIALLAGSVAITGRALFGAYLWSLVGMELFLVLAIAADWAAIDPGARVLFAAFAALGLLMVWRAEEARRIRPRGSARPSASYLGHVWFTLVALLDAFGVILVLDLGAPTWLVVVTGVVVAAAGHVALRAVRGRLT